VGVDAKLIANPTMLPLDAKEPTELHHGGPCGTTAGETCKTYSYDATFDALSLKN
jgi:hypothetical protein